jgi:hypothetical protein
MGAVAPLGEGDSLSASGGLGRGAPGKKTALLLPHETRSCGQPGAWTGRSGRSGPAITSEVGSKPG